MRPADALRRHMEMGSTGSLTVDPSDAPRISIYLMQGEILAAECEDDGPQLVRRLVNGGHITTELGQSLLARLCHVPQVGDVLFGTVPDDVVMELYGHRFRQNLADFLLAGGVCEFAAKEDIHVENVQVGHDSYELLERMDRELAQVAPLLPPLGPTVVMVGEEPPLDTLQLRALECLPDSGSIEGLLCASPYEPIRTLLFVAALLDQGSLVVEGDDEEDTADLPVVDDAVEDEPIADEPLAAEDEPTVAEEDPALIDASFDEPVVVGEHELLEPAVVEEAEDIAMFADNDYSRGRGGDGIFTVSRDLLDTVDLSGLELLGPGEADDEQLLEMEDGDEVEAAGGAVSLRFGSPPLTNEEAITKIEVTNEVLRQLALALDDEHGSGSGQASVQLLVESARTAYATLFSGAEAGREGCLKTERMLLNIGKYPERERRRLLNRAMRDLIERGFTMAVERVSEERFEGLLERIAGYQHRLGL
jgi:hypothetical protein